MQPAALAQNKSLVNAFADLTVSGQTPPRPEPKPEAKKPAVPANGRTVTRVVESAAEKRDRYENVAVANFLKSMGEIFSTEILETMKAVATNTLPEGTVVFTFGAQAPICFRPVEIYNKYAKKALDGSQDEIEKALQKKSLSKESVASIKEIFKSMAAKAQKALSVDEGILDCTLLAASEQPKALPKEEFYKSTLFKTFILTGAEKVATGLGLVTKVSS